MSMLEWYHVRICLGVHLVPGVKAHSGAVMGVYGVPGQSNNLLSIGGDGTAKLGTESASFLYFFRLFDMERKTRISCFDGHETIVRSASFAPDSPSNPYQMHTKCSLFR